VPGQLSDSSHVLVDVGTGYYVEKTTDAAMKFYNSKVAALQKSLGDLEKVVAQKSQNVRVVEDVIRRKVLAQQQQGEGAKA
jgi:prefoldin alpha subunit